MKTARTAREVAIQPAERPRHEGRTRVSVIVPVRERPEPLPELYEEYSAPLRAAGIDFEFIFVSDAGYHAPTSRLSGLRERGEPVRVLEVGQTMTEGALLQAAAAHAEFDVLVTLPCYRRVEAEVLPGLIARVGQGMDLVVARRWPRRDSWLNRLQTSAFHALIRGLSNERVHDIACGVRVMRRELLDQIPLYGDFYRFLPLFALRGGWRVEEVPCPQHRDDTRTRVYGPGIYLRRLLDTLGVFFLLRFTEKPLRFFGMVGSVFSLAGGAILMVLLIQRLGGQGIANRPLLLLGVLLVVLGVQAIALGLIGEIIVHLGAGRQRSYRVRKSE